MAAYQTLAESVQKVNALQQEVAESRYEAEAIQQQHDREVAELRAQHDAQRTVFREQVDDLEQQLESSGQADLHQREVAVIRAEHQAELHELQQKVGSIQDLQEQKEKNQLKIDALQHRVDNLPQEMAALKQMLDEDAVIRLSEIEINQILRQTIMTVEQSRDEYERKAHDL